MNGVAGVHMERSLGVETAAGALWTRGCESLRLAYPASDDRHSRPRPRLALASGALPVFAAQTARQVTSSRRTVPTVAMGVVVAGVAALVAMSVLSSWAGLTNCLTRVLAAVP